MAGLSNGVWPPSVQQNTELWPVPGPHGGGHTRHKTGQVLHSLKELTFYQATLFPRNVKVTDTPPSTTSSYVEIAKGHLRDKCNLPFLENPKEIFRTIKPSWFWLWLQINRINKPSLLCIFNLAKPLYTLSEQVNLTFASYLKCAGILLDFLTAVWQPWTIYLEMEAISALSF